MRKMLALTLIAFMGGPAFASDPDALPQLPLFDYTGLYPWNGSDDRRFMASADYLLWWLREGRIPATLTTGSPAAQGVLGTATS